MTTTNEQLQQIKPRLDANLVNKFIFFGLLFSSFTPSRLFVIWSVADDEGVELSCCSFKNFVPLLDNGFSTRDIVNDDNPTDASSSLGRTYGSSISPPLRSGSSSMIFNPGLF
mmetsp:Transcript_54049/g.80268  ORF Transcript_54049/g.80268 Transcript_54049/m.80268 type:complete len:113 (-) Transcript_54049:456-794(-)